MGCAVFAVWILPLRCPRVFTEMMWCPGMSCEWSQLYLKIVTRARRSFEVVFVFDSI